MNIFGICSVCLGNVDLLEVMNLNFKISACDLYIDDYLLIFGSSQCVSILLVWLDIIRHHCVLN